MYPDAIRADVGEATEELRPKGLSNLLKKCGVQSFANPESGDLDHIVQHRFALRQKSTLFPFSENA